MGRPLLFAGIVGAAVVIVAEPYVAAPLLAFPIAYYLVAGSIRSLFFRYAIPVVPFLCLTAAWLVCLGVNRCLAARPAPTLAERWRFAALSTAAAVAIAARSLGSVLQFDRILSQVDNRVVLAQWFEQHVPPGSSVLQTGSRYGLAQFDQKMKYTSWRWDGGRGMFLVGNRRPPAGLTGFWCRSPRCPARRRRS